MCAPKTKIEREVDRLHRQLPMISERQKRWALKQCDYKRVCKYRGRKCDVEHVVIATTKSGWQVLRHFYVYAYYRRGKLSDYEINGIMEQWFKGGAYVFYARERFGMSLYNDAWCLGRPMSIKRGELGGYALSDPRDIPFNAVRYERVAKQFAYVDVPSTLRVDKVFRAVNVSPIWETMIKRDIECFMFCERMGITYDAKKSAAVKICLRHHYDFKSPEWRDLIDNLIYLGKDIRNPHYICPTDLHAMHDEILKQAQNKRRKYAKAAYRAAQLRREREELERLEREKKAAEQYPIARKRFFGITIQGEGIQIRALQSVKEFMEEGEVMHHCVFGNAYYDTQRHPHSLILSAKTDDGTRAETIEVDLRDYHIVQSRGKHNQDSPYHKQIIDLMTANMGMIRQANSRVC